MPNWCYTTTCFKGSLENITRLADDIYKTIEWTKENNYEYCNLFHFFSLNDFDVDSYITRFKKRWDRPNFRGSIIDNYPFIIEYYGDYALLYPSFETAWWMDFNILHLISMLYNVEFSAYSEEPSMEIYTKCKNGSIDTFDYDIAICPDWEQIDDDEYYSYADLITSGKKDDPRVINEIKRLDDHNIDYEILDVLDDTSDPKIYGTYYGPAINGVYYDTPE